MWRSLARPPELDATISFHALVALNFLTESRVLRDASAVRTVQVKMHRDGLAFLAHFLAWGFAGTGGAGIGGGGVNRCVLSSYVYCRPIGSCGVIWLSVTSIPFQVICFS